MKTKINFIDLFILLTIIFSTTGFIIAKAEKSPINKIIEGKEKVAIEVLIHDIRASKENLFKVGSKTAITVRNKPCTKLEIIKIEERPKLAIAYDRTGTYKPIPDPNKFDFQDFIVTISDTAFKTKDGYVIGNNKIKIGNKVELEGFNYRLPGEVVNIYSIKEKNSKS